MFLGLVIVLVGAILILLERFGLPRLPGDIVIEREKFTVYIPIATSIIISIVLTVLLFFVVRLFR